MSCGLLIVHVVLDKDDDPYKIFESLNAKGEKLSQADLIRNYFFMRIHVDKQERMEQMYHKYWRPMQEKLDNDLSEYICHFLMKHSAMVKQNDVYLNLKKCAESKSQTEVIEELINLAKFSDYYEKLRPDA